MASLSPIELELRSLRKGRGVHAEDVTARLGPALSALCGIAQHDDESTRQQKLIDMIRSSVAELPEDFRVALLAALAAGQETANMRFLDERVGWLSTWLSCSDRTARRRIDQAIKRLGKLMDHRLASSADRATDADLGWYVASLKSLILLDGPEPQSTEERCIVSTVDGLEELVHRASAPRAPEVNGPPRLLLELLHGGKLDLDTSSGRHFRYLLSLPERLNRGDQHEYTVQMRVPADQQMAPQYLCRPLRRHDLFRVQIRFALDTLPRRIWRITEAAPHTLDDPGMRSDVIVPNRFGEVRGEFRDLRIGFGYGFQWQW